jgi:catechol 2,3-dioxygenase-like lactoylglutathione lyase family enzyme
MRRRFRWVLPLAVSLLALHARAQVAPPILVTAVDSVGLTVSDLDRSLEFYTQVLPFRKVSEKEVVGEAYEKLEGVFGARLRIARLRLGEESLVLTEYLAPKGRPAPPDARSNDRSFQHVAIVVSDMAKAYAHLRAHRVTHASTGPQRLPDWNPNAGGIEAFYFKDPDGHPLEIIFFPKGKGDPRWQRPDAPLFMGIDHTAIVVSDTESSLKFWRDTLGLRVAGASENYGTEQEHLNNVFGARLRITGLRAAKGPGIEFLEYLAPRDGKPYPSDERANDLVHWQTQLTVAKAADAEALLRAAHAPLVSPGAVAVPESGAGLLVRDPDGHAVELAEPAASLR